MHPSVQHSNRVTALSSLCLLAGCAQLSTGAVTAAADKNAAVAVYAVSAGGAPVRDAVVTLLPLQGGGAPAAPVVIDLFDKRFEPKVLVLTAGSSVTFKNLDGMGHQVYSFSAAKPFSLKLAPGESATLANLGKPGVVVLGCKIHNEMIGYLYVTDAPYYGKTDSNGYLRLGGLAPGSYRLGLWRAEVEQETRALERSVTLRTGEEQVVRLRL